MPGLNQKTQNYKVYGYFCAKTFNKGRRGKKPGRSASFGRADSGERDFIFIKKFFHTRPDINPLYTENYRNAWI